MVNQKFISYLFTAILIICFNSSAYAIGSVKIDPVSPMLADSERIATIYYQSCLAGSNDNLLSGNFPMYMQDELSDRFQKIYSPTKFTLWHAIPGMVEAGYDFGRTLALTDLNGVYIEDQCKEYSVNFAATVVNNPANWNGNDINPPLTSPSVIPTLPIPNNPFNDIFAPKETDHIKVTPRIAQQNGCRYMYITLASQPRIDVSPLDATLDMMENMMWHDYNKDVIRSSYYFILQGTKQGQYLFNSRQDLKLCYV